MWSYIKKLFSKPETSQPVPIETFISESLIKICKGIRIAQAEITRIPYTKEEEKYYTPYIMPTPKGGREKDIYDVQFDVTITTSSTQSNTNKNDLKVDILVVAANVSFLDGKEKNANQTTSSLTRLQFSVPVIYPSMPLPHPGNEK